MKVLALTLVLAAATFGQGFDRYGERYRGNYGRDGYRDRDNYRGPDAVDRAWRDLQMALSNTFDRDRGRVDHALRELDKFRDHWNRGKFDRHPLDEVIDEMSHLSRSHRVDIGIRERLGRDANDLRDLRASGGRYDYGWRR